VCRYGPPKLIQSDQGTEYINNIIEALMTWFKVRHTQTLAYRPQANGQIERQNRSILRHMRCLVLEKECTTTWSDYLPLLSRIMNMTYSNEIGTTPSNLLFGNAISMNRGLLEPFKEEELQDITSADYVIELNKNLNKIIMKAKKLQQEAIQCRLDQSPESPTSFEVGDLVLVDYIMRPPSKTMCPWRGPLAVVGITGNVYACQDLQTSQITSYDIHRLKKYNCSSDPNAITPLQLSALDQDLKFVERIIAHEGTPKKRSEMQFLIKWKDLPDEENSNIPWKDAKDLQALDDYILTHPELRSLDQPTHRIHCGRGGRGGRGNRRVRGHGARGSGRINNTTNNNNSRASA